MARFASFAVFSPRLPLTVLLTALYVGGCDGGREAPTTNKTGEELPPLAEDRSLTVAQYVDLGMPAPDRKWGPPDYVRVVDVLRSVAAKDVHQLPRLDSPASGKLMAHLVSPQNLEMLQDETFSIEQRMALINALMPSCKALMVLYLNPESRGLHFDRELIELVVFQARVGRIMFALALRFMSTMSPEQAASPVRKRGWQRMWSGIAMDVAGRFASISERSHYRPAQRRLLALDVEETLSSYYPYLSQLTQREIPVRVNELVDQETDEGVKAALEKLLATLKGDFPEPWTWPEPSVTPEPKEKQEEKVSPPEPRILKSQAGSPGTDGWVLAEASDGSVSVSFPNVYNELAVEAGEAEEGGVFTRTMATRTQEGATFTVLSLTRLDGNPPKEEGFEGMVKSFKEKGDLRAAKDLTREGMRGKEIETWSRKSEARGQFWNKGNHLYMLMVEVPFGQSEILRKDGDRFFSSFELK